MEKYPSHVVAKWLGHSPKVAAQHYLMSREHHFEDVVRGSSPGPAPAAAVSPEATDDRGAECCARVVQNASQHASAPDRTEPHETTEPAAAKRKRRTNHRPQRAGAKKGCRGHGWPCSRKMAGTGSEQTSKSAEKPPTAPRCGANCSATPDGRVDLLARAVLLVAGMAIPEHDRAAVLARVVAFQRAEREAS